MSKTAAECAARPNRSVSDARCDPAQIPICRIADTTIFDCRMGYAGADRDSVGVFRYGDKVRDPRNVDKKIESVSDPALKAIRSPASIDGST